MEVSSTVQRCSGHGTLTKELNRITPRTEYKHTNQGSFPVDSETILHPIMITEAHQKETIPARISVTLESYLLGVSMVHDTNCNLVIHMSILWIQNSFYGEAIYIIMVYIAVYYNLECLECQLPGMHN